jgi:hypothetical protein
MLRDEGGGWCDCGDHTAWREGFVFCQFHLPQGQPHGQSHGQPPINLPPAGYPAVPQAYNPRNDF